MQNLVIAFVFGQVAAERQRTQSFRDLQAVAGDRLKHRPFAIGDLEIAHDDQVFVFGVLVRAFGFHPIRQQLQLARASLVQLAPANVVRAAERPSSAAAGAE